MNKINSTGEVASTNAVSNNHPLPMRMDAARGQQALPPLDSPSNLRLHASGSTPTASTDQTVQRVAPDACRQNQPASTNPITLFAKLMTGSLALLAGHRVATYPGDFAKDPGGTLWAAINLAQRATAEHLQTGNHSVIDRYSHYIPDDSPCYGARAEITHSLPSNVQGRWYPGKSLVELSNNIQLQTPPAEVAAHEFVHCYTHPEFRARNEKHPSWQAMNEGLTTHLTEKVPSTRRFWHSGKDAYHTFKLPSGKSWPQAAQDIEKKVGEDTLHRAFFSGDDDAIRKVSSAAAQIYPQVASQRTESQMWLAGQLRGGQHLAECYAGALLAAGQPLPGTSTHNMLPVFSYSDISPDQANRMQRQAQASKQRMGDVFDAAFFAADLKTQKTALSMLREDLLMHWKPVL
ncbi:type III effector [Erwinia psidii]|uniref:Type III effector n=1 Tax=Erwinia psidii TaxID=69224 RepID=A0A3N6V0Q7_9GAMM|nr:type III effector [Erwinia psidii]MCX8955932.1 type III effector [Erwinia psidii]MCX8961304.1 type III effector [Erwinia psidii]MCX8963848.1 type III effector [Erwinia psidii]RQM38645.1 type III effector [Erwinia psidii]